MSLNFVTKKFEGHSLEEEERQMSIRRAEKVVEDSGTESDDEVEVEVEAAVDAEIDNVVDSGISLNLRSSVTRANSGRRQLPPLLKEQRPDAPGGVMLRPIPGESGLQRPMTVDSGLQRPRTVDCGLQRPVTVDSGLQRPVEDVGLDDNDNHSSEEELEDIINKKKVYVSEPQQKPTTSATGRISAVEKRKWSEVDQTTTTSRTGSGSSGDEEVSGYMGYNAYTPVQFCTSPPLNVYKPRRSQSPPPKMFHLATNGTTNTNNSNSFRGQRPSGAFRPRVLTGGGGGVAGAWRGGVVLSMGGLAEEEEGEEDRRSPNKRTRTTPTHRTTPRPHSIQRPCLDFEKMQQIKTKVVTSWRQGTELSLFCW